METREKRIVKTRKKSTKGKKKSENIKDDKKALKTNKTNSDQNFICGARSTKHIQGNSSAAVLKTHECDSEDLEAEKNVKAMIFGMLNSDTPSYSSSDESSNDITQPKVKKKRHKKNSTRFHKVTRHRRHPTTSEELVLPCNSPKDEFDEHSLDVTERTLEESGSEISQDENYQHSIRKDFVVDSEQMLIKENLLNENEKLAEAVSVLETKLLKQMESSVVMEKSLKKFKIDQSHLQREKTRLQKTLKTRMETIADLKEHTVSLKNTCDTLSKGRQNESDRKKLELDALKKQLRSTERQLKTSKEENEKRCLELTKNHVDFLSKIVEETRGLTETLSKALGYSAQPCKINCHEEVLSVLREASQGITTLWEGNNPLQETIKDLKDKMRIQNKTLSNVLKDKKSLGEELFELSRQNKALLKDKTKLQREIEWLKKESVKAKNISQSFKVRLEELKASIRSIRREKEAVVQEKQNVGAKLKKLGVDHDALTKKFKNAAKERSIGTNHVITTKVREELEGMCMKSVDELQYSDSRLVELKRRKEAKKNIRSSDVIREHVKIDTFTLVQKYDNMCQRSRRLDTMIEKLMTDGQDLKRLVRNVTDENKHLTGQVDMLIDEINVGHMEDCALKKALDQNCVVLGRYAAEGKVLHSSNKSLKVEVMQTTVNWMKDIATLQNLREELYKVKRENQDLRSERRKNERSLENYKELVRVYSRVTMRSSRIQCAVGEMMIINRELLRFVGLVQKQKDVLSKTVNGMEEGIDLIQALYQKLKRFSGKQSKKPASSVLLFENNEKYSEEALQASVKCLREKLQAKEHLIISLKTTLDAERNEGYKLGKRVQKLLSNEDRISLQLCALKVSKKGKNSGFINFKKKKCENESRKNEGGEFLNERQVSNVIRLVRAKQQLENEIKESLEMEKRLRILVKYGDEYTEILHKKCFDFEDNLESAGKINNKEMASKCFMVKEKRRLDNEFVFKEAHEGLLEKQITLLRKQKKCCTKVLLKYDEELEGYSDHSIIHSLVDILTTTASSLDLDPMKYETHEDISLETKVTEESNVSNNLSVKDLR